MIYDIVNSTKFPVIKTLVGCIYIQTIIW